MTRFRRLSAGVALPLSALCLAVPAAAQDDPLADELGVELRRANAATRAYCERNTRIKKERMTESGEALIVESNFVGQVDGSDREQLIAEEQGLKRRINMAELRGDDRSDMRPNALGDLYRRLETVKRQRAGESATEISELGRNTMRDTFNFEKRRYHEAMLSCLDARDRFPNRAWHDPSPEPGSGGFGAQPDSWDDLPDATGTAADDAEKLPEQKGVEYRVWMTGTFDTGGGVLTLNPAGGRYQYQNGRMSTTRIDGNVMEGRWEQDMSAGKCPDERYWGRYRLTFTSGGFTGVFGYCDEEPHRIGGFQGTRRGAQ
jgi:hypothetical protein